MTISLVEQNLRNHRKLLRQLPRRGFADSGCNAPDPRCITLPMENHMNTVQAAEWLGLKEITLREWRSDEKGPPYIEISARCIRYAMEDLIQWRDDRRHVPSVRAAVEDAERRISQRKRN
jgi:hypothetical protein